MIIMNITSRFLISILSTTIFVACGEEKPLVSKLVTISCGWNTSIQLSYEELRLETPLPFSGEHTLGRDQTAYATRIVSGAGFDEFVSNFKDQLCAKNGTTAVTNFEQAQQAVNDAGVGIWRAAVDRAQEKRARKSTETLASSDDRMLYWARVQMTKILRQWNPNFILTAEQKEQLQWEFERSSRGQKDIHLPEGKTVDGKLYRRMIISGFDVFLLGTPGRSSTDLRNGNPSAAIALALDGKQFTLSDGSILHIESYILPVNYDPFTKGMQEDTLGPWFREGPKRVDASITLSQGREGFDLEQYNGRYHGGLEGNDGMDYCPAGQPQNVLAIGARFGEGVNPITLQGSGCNIVVPQRWYGLDTASRWIKDAPPQFSKASFPVEKILAANSQRGIVHPAYLGAEQAADFQEGFNVVWNTAYSYFPDCAQTSVENMSGNGAVNTMPDLSKVKDPAPSWCAREGSGGDYLSNESAYRNTVLRDAMGLTIPAGHIHVPVMNHFYIGDTANNPQDDNAITDTLFESYRTAIVGQGTNLLKAIGESLVE